MTRLRLVRRKLPTLTYTIACRSKRQRSDSSVGDTVSLMMIGTYGVFNKKLLLGLYDRESLSLSTCLMTMAGSAETPLREK